MSKIFIACMAILAVGCVYVFIKLWREVEEEERDALAAEAEAQEAEEE
jgi:hypothetical protein